MNIRGNCNTWFRYVLTLISPKLSVKFWYRFYFKRPLDLKKPQTLDEKIQWMKLYYYKDNDLVKQCADKYAVREYVAQCGLKHILNDLYGTYRSANEIDWKVLPEKFVLKWNFGCGGNVICSNKADLDIAKAQKELTHFGKIRFHLLAAEPQYDIKDKRILCERFIESEDGALPEDYKFYCFNGEAKFVLCCLGRGEKKRPAFYFFDRAWNLLRYNKMGKQAPLDFTLPKPDGIDEAFKYAEILSRPFPFVRVDFYIEHGKVLFGEMTFTPAGGFDTGRLPESNVLFGSMVSLEQYL